jgi:hypothetical protein
MQAGAPMTQFHITYRLLDPIGLILAAFEFSRISDNLNICSEHITYGRSVIHEADVRAEDERCDTCVFVGVGASHFQLCGRACVLARLAIAL